MATNLAVPGLGSLVGGRKVGVLQIALYLAGFVITICFWASVCQLVTGTLV